MWWTDAPVHLLACNPANIWLLWWLEGNPFQAHAMLYWLVHSTCKRYKFAPYWFYVWYFRKEHKVQIVSLFQGFMMRKSFSGERRLTHNDNLIYISRPHVHSVAINRTDSTYSTLCTPVANEWWGWACVLCQYLIFMERSCNLSVSESGIETWKWCLESFNASVPLCCCFFLFLFLPHHFYFYKFS